MACVCADGPALLPFVVVPGASSQVLPLCATRDYGSKKSVRLAGSLEDLHKQVVRQDTPGFNQKL